MPEAPIEPAPTVAPGAVLSRGASGPWSDLALTLPIFIAYHLGVAVLPVRNAADHVTRELVELADHNILGYWGLTLAIGLVFVGGFVVAGRGHAFRPSRFVWIALEGVVYAVAMAAIARWVVGSLRLGGAGEGNVFGNLVLSLGAGFYEEVVFRVLLYGFGLKLIYLVFPLLVPGQKLLVAIGWALATAIVFSGWHYVGTLGDAFDLRSFVFRAVCGVVFVVIYTFRGFAPVVWTHTLYDVWVLVL